METVNASALLYKALPTSESTSDQKEGENYIKTILKAELPRSEQKNLEAELRWQFVLDKHSVDNKNKRKKNKKQFLTRKERFNKNLLKLPKDGWSYSKLSNLRKMWQGYMRNALDTIGKDNPKIPTCDSSEWQSFSANLAKCELVGSELRVVRSKNTNLVDMRGTVVLETKETFQIVTPKSQLKTLIKKDSVFSFELDDMRFTFFGKYLATRPADRSAKKIKSYMFPDL